MAQNESAEFIDFFVQERLLDESYIKLNSEVNDYLGVFENPEDIDTLGIRNKTLGEVYDEIVEKEARLVQLGIKRKELARDGMYRFCGRNIAVNSLVDGTKPIRQVTKYDYNRGPTYDAGQGIIEDDPALYDTGKFRMVSKNKRGLFGRLDLFNVSVLPPIRESICPLVRIEFLD